MPDFITLTDRDGDTVYVQVKKILTVGSGGTGEGSRIWFSYADDRGYLVVEESPSEIAERLGL